MAFISKEEAIAQGSTWRQVLAIAAFHDSEARKKSLDADAIARMSFRRQKEHRAAMQLHRDAARHFRTMSEEMKSASL